MKFSHLLLIPFLFCAELSAQEESSSEISNVSAFFHASGILFNNPSFDAYSYFPNSKEERSVFCQTNSGGTQGSAQ
ncbi:MAG: hypothetical protein ACI8P7_001335 [Candidatus Azotimanducaceae bacterium]|jgi:hypothetical protein